MDQELSKTGWAIQEVYATDISDIKAFFRQLNNKDKAADLPESFGLPFLIAAREGKIAGFVSLVPGADGTVHYKCYNDRFNPYFSGSKWQQEVAAAFEKQRLLFTNALQLNSGIDKLLRWVNLS